MRRLSRRSVSHDDDRTPSDGITDVSPTRSLASTASRGSRMGHSRRSSGVEDSTPTRPPMAGSPPKSGTNKKMLKIGANVRFRGDVMECDTVLLCGRLQGCVESRRMVIREGANFIGDAKVEEADVHGTMEGTLRATSKLAIRSTGTVCGTVVYRRMTMEDGGELEGTFECSARRTPRDTPSPLQRLRELEQRHQQQKEKELKGKDQRQAIQVQGEGEEVEDVSLTVERRPQQASGMASDEAGDGDLIVPGVALEESVVITVPFVGTDVELMPVEVSAIGPEAEEREEDEFGVQGSIPMTIGEEEGSMPHEQSSSRWVRCGAGSRTSSEVPTTVVQAAGVTAAESPSWLSTAKPKVNPESLFASRSPVRDATPPARAPPSKAPVPRTTPSSGLRTSAPWTEGVVSTNRRIFAGNAASPSPPFRAAPGISPTNPGRSPGVSPAKTLEAKSGKIPGAQTPVQEASSSLSDHDATPQGLASNPFVAQDASRTFRRNRSPPATTRETPPSSGVRGAPVVIDRSSSVAAMVETWPPISPRQGKLPVTWEKLTQVSTAAEPSSPGVTSRVAPPQGAGNSGVEIGGGMGGGEGEGVAMAENAGGSTGEVASSQAQNNAGPIKACEFGNCTMEACWGAPRFRPRYCARHKRPGNVIMDPVPMEEGDRPAEPEGAAGSSGPPQREGFKNRSAKLSKAPPREPVGLAPPPPRHVVSPGESSSEPVVSVQGFVVGRLQQSGDSNGDVEGGGRGDIGAGDDSQIDEEYDVDDDDEDDDDDDDDDSDLLDDSEEDDSEDEGWDDDEVDDEAVSGDVELGAEINGSGNRNGVARERVARGGTRSGGVGRAGKLFASTSSASLPRLSQTQPQLQEQARKSLRRRESDMDRPFGTDSGDSFDHEGDVLARVAKFERLAKKGSSISKPKTPSKLPLKSSSGNNIADFYGGESDGEETAFSLESFNKNLLLAQAAEAGTHTEDGQLRPRASEQRDQQRLAHLVKVGKLGSVLRGKGVAAMGKRR